MKNYILPIVLTVITGIFSIFYFFIFVPTNTLTGQSVLYDGPVLQKLEISKSPSEIEGPTPPKGVSSNKWNEKFSYRLVGEIKKFNVDAYKAKHPNDFFVPHKEASPSIYMKTLPSVEEIGQYKIGLPL